MTTFAQTAPDASRELHPRSRRLLEHAAVHALGWLALANLVGLLLASLLLVPELGGLLGPLTYGRWMPLHLDLQFYGWCSLPVVALLLRVYLPPGDPGRLPELAVGAWSGALAWSAVSWLAGRSSGKVFLDWTGPARWVLAAALATAALAVMVSFARQLRRGTLAAPRPRKRPARAALWARAAAIVALVPVPIALVAATRPGVYPPINPDSGGATHSSTAASVLAVIAVVLAAPVLSGLGSRDGGRMLRRAGWLLAVHGAGISLLVLAGGDHSHHEALQQIALWSLVPWLPLTVVALRTVTWPDGLRPWLRAWGGWGALLLVSGLAAGAPGVLERWKFTNALVGHVHIALAGFVTCWLVVLLASLLEPTTLRGLFTGVSRAGTARLRAGRAFWAWHLGLAAQGIALTVLGTLEGFDPTLVHRRAPIAIGLYAVRALGGLAMTAASVAWLAAAVRRLGGVPARVAAAARTESARREAAAVAFTGPPFTGPRLHPASASRLHPASASRLHPASGPRPVHEP